jgi:biopolymer transport protein ExbB
MHYIRQSLQLCLRLLPQLSVLCLLLLFMVLASPLLAQDAPAANAPTAAAKAGGFELTLRGIFDAGGTIGFLIVILSFFTVVLVIQHALAFRKSVMIPELLRQELSEYIAAGQFAQAQQRCQTEPSLLSVLVYTGLKEADLGYHEMEKAMEECVVEQAARMFRRLEYLNLIGTVAPMLGLLGTVWGMILTFVQFSSSSSPQISDLAPGISSALVTTLFGLIVAIPALAAYAILRNTVDELVAEATHAAEQMFSGYRRHQKKLHAAQAPVAAAIPRKPMPSVTIEREKPDRERPEREKPQ